MHPLILENRDYVVVIAKTATQLQFPHQAQAWETAQQAVFSLIQQCEELDPDGVTLYVSCIGVADPECFRQHTAVTSPQLATLLAENYPPHELPLRPVLRAVLQDYEHRKSAGLTKANGELILLLVDGEPQDRMEIAKAIRQATKALDRPDELAIGLIQVGDDPLATGFFQSLDDDLQANGATFDIVNTFNVKDLASASPTTTLLNVLED